MGAIKQKMIRDQEIKSTPTKDTRPCGWCGTPTTGEFCSKHCKDKCMAAYGEDMCELYEDN